MSSCPTDQHPGRQRRRVFVPVTEEGWLDTANPLRQ